MPKEDIEAVELVKESMKRDGVDFVLNATYRRVEGSAEEGPIRVILEDDGGE